MGDRAFLGRAVGESGVAAVIEVDSVPLLPGTRELAEAGARNWWQPPKPGLGRPGAGQR